MTNDERWLVSSFGFRNSSFLGHWWIIGGSLVIVIMPVPGSWPVMAMRCGAGTWTAPRPGIRWSHQHVIDALAGTAAADLDEVLFERFEVAVAQGARVAQQVVSSSIPSKRVVPEKGKVSSSWSRTWKTSTSCRPCRSISRPRNSGSRSPASRRSSPPCRGRRVLRHARRIFSMSVLSRGFGTCIALTDGVDVPVLAARRHDLAHVLVEGHQPDESCWRSSR
jgi:hypothetical protein